MPRFDVSLMPLMLPPLMRLPRARQLLQPLRARRLARCAAKMRGAERAEARDAALRQARGASVAAMRAQDARCAMRTPPLPFTPPLMRAATA